MKQMTLDEMKLAVCEKLPEMIHIHSLYSTDGKQRAYWRDTGRSVFWHTEGLQVCHEAEKLLTYDQKKIYLNALSQILARDNDDEDAEMVYYTNTWDMTTATYEQRLEALCRVWWPERFE